MHTLARKVLFPLPTLFGIDLSITNEVVLLWIAAAVTFGVLWMACRRRESVARGAFANLFEMLIEFIEKDIVREGVGKQGLAWAPFLLTLFFFILFANLMGLAPLPNHVKSITSNINVTAALAVTVFCITLAINLSRHGIWGFVKKFRPAGVPGWLTVLVVPIEIVTWLVKPFSLAIRLFANMLAGHAVVGMFVGMTVGAAVLLKALPFAGAVVMSGFEIFSSFIQAFIFTMLAGLYIREALEETH